MASPQPEQSPNTGNARISTSTLFLDVVLPNGQSIPIGQRHGPYLQVIRNVRQWCPYLYVEIDDIAHAMSNNDAKLNDGSLIGITLGLPNTTETSIWQCYGTPTRSPSTVNPQVFTYKVKALPAGVTDSMVQKPMRSWSGTATDVLKEITTQLHLDFVTNVKTTDSMHWLSTHKTWKEYMQSIAEHTYAGDQAVIMDGIDTTLTGGNGGTYYLMNVPDIFRGQAKMYLHHGANFSHHFTSIAGIPSLSCAKAQHESRSGYHGFRSLYGLDTQEIGKDGNVSYHSKVTPMDASRLPDVASQSHHVGNASPKVLPRPLPCGNVHDNYIRAEHIFLKSRGLYGQHVTVLVNVPTGLSLFDLVAFTQSTSTGAMMTEISGYYFVSGKNSFVNYNQYWEKIELTSGGLN